jgi:hypothetical protein
MLKRDIKYTDFDGNEATDTYYFNLTKSELVELEAGKPGGLDQWIRNVIDTKDNNALISEFKKIILLSYGEKSPDGKRFMKSDEMREEFSQTAAFDELFIELATNEDAAVKFLQGVVPKDLQLTDPDTPILPPPNIQPVEKKSDAGMEG